MKKKIAPLLSILVLSLSLCGCTEQSITKEFGASTSWGVFEGTVTVIEKKEEK